ncbi:MAG: hypothetical protein UR23_C0060G0007 [Candidatus Roizmanbacteria bacterium GW2011_GWA2_32_13]|uniref:Uncharacterized protein n=1 Tax=Candidatus Roizmanbacteria bacterium GW2011_GWA2_32_13 TaxID=1618475 RepID=A0A0G0BN24_9BACT|nr:MAG: hypothetical protein UR23_C0060G0007 [Candidatus Roizmanbacteria bacterium GW2011_GWA2_32_13]
MTFGDIIQYEGDKYVFLVPSLQFVYVAKILTDSETKLFEKMYQDHQKRGEPVEEKGVFWFVRLTCKDFKDQWAHLANAQKNVIYSKWFKPINSEKLNVKDLISLKKEILEKRTWPELKDLIKDIEV